MTIYKMIQSHEERINLGVLNYLETGSAPFLKAAANLDFWFAPVFLCNTPRFTALSILLKALLMEFWTSLIASSSGLLLYETHAAKQRFIKVLIEDL